LAIAGCHIDIRKGRSTFEVQGRWAVFCHMKEKVSFPNSSLLDKSFPSLEIDMKNVLNSEDPPDLDWISAEDPNQRYVKMEFAAPMSPNMPKVEAHTSNESSMSDYCRFAQAVLSLPLMEGIDANFDLGVEQIDSSPSDELRMQYVLCADNGLRHKLMKTKDLQPELLRWFL